MSRLTFPLRAVLAAALFLGAGSAMAGSANATVTISNLKLTVIDTDPTDGIFAAATFVSAKSHAQGHEENKYFSYTDFDTKSGTTWEPTSAYMGSGNAYGGAFSAGFGHSHAEARVNEPYGSENEYGGDVWQTAYFQLTPNSRVTLQAQVSMSSANEGPGARSNASILVNLGEEGGSGDWFTHYLNPIGSTSQTFNQMVELVWHNDSAETRDFYVGTSLHAESFVQPTSPVPEPGTYAMFATGALVVGALARRRRAPGV